ncbi:flagellar assembly protein T N-terminal domain-containing protein [Motiliproteus sp. SC1-56]|uniref:flagellar assembly protein T N-terminal domain-containing protein n=1 Tax=Motiliproteus sp. SC1-56 TaxID=2799565 RepID=UPI001A8F31C0|nr:flagellar assembly protein T N-terminal domain-containing protein [Motiliproteus sp. SC1-56]
MRLTFLLLMALSFTLTPVRAESLTVEAEGRGLIRNQDLESARHDALRDATQQAMLQAGAQISSTQTIEQGVLTVDNLQVRSLGSISNVRVLEEQVQGAMLMVRIQAEVGLEENCPNEGPGRHYRKSVAFAAFPLEHPLQANRGALHDVEQVLPRVLAETLGRQAHLHTLNASHLQAQPNPTTASTQQQHRGALTNSLQSFRDLDVQFIVSGVVRDIGMFDPEHNRSNNLLVDWYDQLDYLGSQHLRSFAVDIFIHDGFSGALLFNRSYRQAGLWNLDKQARTGFNSPAFIRTDYGRKVAQVIEKASQEIQRQLKCEPFRARIVETDQQSITFNAGSVAGIRPGDQLQVERRSMFYDPRGETHIRVEPTRNSLVVNEVYPLFSTGKIAEDTGARNIQQDDLVVAW